MTLNPENDVYTGDLSILNIRKQEWIRADSKSAVWRRGSYVVLIVGFAFILYMGTRTYGGDTMMSQLPLHLSIWITALITFLVARKGKVSASKPFNGFHSARFEVDDDTVYYVYQQGMSLKTYYIHDEDIKSILRDDDSGVILINGKAAINTQKRKSETEEEVDEFYALVPFDKYDLDDMLAPYGRKVKKYDGKLRQKYIDDNQS